MTQKQVRLNQLKEISELGINVSGCTFEGVVSRLIEIQKQTVDNVFNPTFKYQKN